LKKPLDRFSHRRLSVCSTDASREKNKNQRTIIQYELNIYQIWK
jgi:hypothetical protein